MESAEGCDVLVLKDDSRAKRSDAGCRGASGVACGAVFWVVCAVACPSFAAEFVSPHGYRMSYPEGWSASTGAPEEVSEELPQDIRDRVDLVDAVFLDGKEDAFVENVNVVVAGGDIPLTQAGLMRFREDNLARATEVGLSVEEASSSIEQIGPHRALSLHRTISFPGRSVRVRQWMACIPGPGRVFVVTCSSLPEAFAQYEATFREMIASLQATEPSPDAKEASRDTSPGPLMIGILLVVAVLGAMIWAVRRGLINR